jgi:PEP-CTERM motif-containing protein
VLFQKGRKEDMMRKVFFSVMVVFLCVQLASADYENPPGWENNPYFTHQSWSFIGDGTGNPPPNPSAPDDGGVGNPYGDPSFNMSAGTWVWELGEVYGATGPLGERFGGWRIDAPSGTPDVEREEWFTVYIPNEPNPNLTKEIWIEMTFLVSSVGHAGSIAEDIDLQVWANGNVYNDDYKFDDIGSTDPVGFGQSLLGEVWGRASATFSYFPQPRDETITLTGWLDPGQYVILDQIDVDTRCIPEPTTMGLLGIGTLALIRRRKNR